MAEYRRRNRKRVSDEHDGEQPVPVKRPEDDEPPIWVPTPEEVAQGYIQPLMPMTPKKLTRYRRRRARF